MDERNDIKSWADVLKKVLPTLSEDTKYVEGQRTRDLENQREEWDGHLKAVLERTTEEAQREHIKEAIQKDAEGR